MAVRHFVQGAAEHRCGGCAGRFEHVEYVRCGALALALCGKCVLDPFAGRRDLMAATLERAR